MDKVEQLRKAREEDLFAIPSTCEAGYIMSDLGTDLDAIEPFTMELTGIVDKMKEELVNEIRILDGTEAPEYENELSGCETKDDQWTTDLRNGFLKTVPTRSSMPDSSSLSCIVRHSSPVSPTLSCVGTCSMPQTGCCGATSDVSGCETDAMNECSVCTVPTISELTLGTPSEAK